MKLPEAFQQTILNNNGKEGELWLSQLPALVQKYLEIWQLESTGSFEDLTFNFVMPVRCQDGSAAVLKAGPHKKGLRRQALTLKTYAGEGAVNILKSADEDGVLLIERVEPGQNLKLLLEQNLLGENQATTCAAEVIHRLLASKNSKKCEDLTAVSIWGLGFEKFLRENCHGLDFPIDKVNRADLLFKNLMATSKEEVVLHGDLHHANILKGTREPWLAIDPKGVKGDPIYEVGAFIRNPMPRIATQQGLDQILVARFKIFHSVLKFDRTRMWGWSYAQCVLAAIWTAEDKAQDWQQWLLLAESLERIEKQVCTGT